MYKWLISDTNKCCQYFFKIMQIFFNDFANFLRHSVKINVCICLTSAQANLYYTISQYFYKWRPINVWQKLLLVKIWFQTCLVGEMLKCTELLLSFVCCCHCCGCLNLLLLLSFKYVRENKSKFNVVLLLSGCLYL